MYYVYTYIYSMRNDFIKSFLYVNLVIFCHQRGWKNKVTLVRDEDFDVYLVVLITL